MKDIEPHSQNGVTGEKPKNAVVAEQPRGLSAIIKNFKENGNLFDPLMGVTYQIDEQGQVKSTTTDR
jgi:hypothetical protein